MKKNSIRWAAVMLLVAAAMVWYLQPFPFYNPEPPVAAQGPLANSLYAYINTATTTTVKTSSGFLASVTINGGTAGTVTLFDVAGGSCTGTPGSGKFATIEAIGATNPVSLAYGIKVNNGICVVTAAATDLTVAFN